MLSEKTGPTLDLEFPEGYENLNGMYGVYPQEKKRMINSREYRLKKENEEGDAGLVKLTLSKESKTNNPVAFKVYSNVSGFRTAYVWYAEENLLPFSEEPSKIPFLRRKKLSIHGYTPKD
jgi:hypothetical protein